MSRSENLPTIPQVLSEAMKMLDNPGVPHRNIEKLLEREPGITTKLVKVANSPYYGAGKVQSVGRALQVLGQQQLKSIVTGVAMQSMLHNKNWQSVFDRVGYFKHSLATAIACRVLGRLRCPAMAEELYTAGMMHDIGLVVMERFIPYELSTNLAESRRMKVPLWEIEQQRLGYDHAEVGGILAERWGFTQTTINAIRYHHEPEKDEKTVEASRIVALANLIAHQCGYCNNQAEESQPMDPYLMMQLEITEGNITLITEVIQQEIERFSESLNLAA